MDYEKERLMALVPDSLPEGIEKWINDVCLKNQHYIFYDKKAGKAYCTHCNKLIDPRYLEHQNASHNKEGNCPECGFTNTYICIGKFKRKMKLHRFQIRVIQNTSEGIVVRRFELSQSYGKDFLTFIKGESRITELQRIFNDGERMKNFINKWTYGDKFEWRESNRKNFTFIGSGYGYFSEVDEYEYRANLFDVISKSHLRFAQKRQGFDYYAGWIKQCEYLEKSKMNSLAEQLIKGNRGYLNFKASSLDKFLGIPKEYIKMVKENDFDLRDIKILKLLIKEKIKITPKMVKNSYRIWHAYYEIKKFKIPLAEYMKYARKNEIIINRPDYYRDYLEFCKTLEYDITNPVIMFPPDIKIAHNREMARVKIVKNEENNRKIKEKLEKAKKKHNFATNKMLIRAPHDANEIIAEGGALDHCVGSYVNRVISGETMILFIRLQSDPDTPYYTVEWRNDKTIQIRGYKNAVPTPEVAEFIKAWENRKKQRIKVAI